MERENTGMTTNDDRPGTTVRTDRPEHGYGYQVLQGRRAPTVDAEELAAADSFDLPGADLSGEEIAVEILAAQADEFTCASCFLVLHRSQLAPDRDGAPYCSDCAS